MVVGVNGLVLFNVLNFVREEVCLGYDCVIN